MQIDQKNKLEDSKVRGLLNLPNPPPKQTTAGYAKEENGQQSHAEEEQHTLNYKHVAILTVFLTLGTLIQGLLSRGFGLTLACMINATAVQSDFTPAIDIQPNQSFSTLISDNCGQLVRSETDGKTNVNDLGYKGTFVWNSIEQANVVAIYSWGSLLVLPFSGFIISLVDARQTVSIGLGIIGLTMGLFPVVTKSVGYGGALAMRLVMGFSNAIISPSMDKVVATYTPWSLRNVLYTIITAGSYLSAVLGNSFGGLLCTSDILGGWPAIYYIASILSALWLIGWETYLVVIPYFTEKVKPIATYTPPSRDKLHTPKNHEKLQNYGIRILAKKMASYFRRFWRDVGHRIALWVMLPSVFASTCTTNLLMNYIPTFYRDVFRISLKNNGLYTSLPFIGILFGSFVFSSIADWLKSRKSTYLFCLFRLTPDRVSKTFNTIGLCGSGLFIVLVTFIPCLSNGAAVTLLTFGSVLYTGIFPGYRVGIVTMSPKWAAVISSISTMTSVVAGIIFPYLQGSIVKHGEASEWHTLFIVIVSIDIIASLAYLAFGSVTTFDPAPYHSLTTTDSPSISNTPAEHHPDASMLDAADTTERTPLLDKSSRR